MGPKEPVARIWNTAEKACSAYWIIPCPRRNDRAQSVGLQLKVLGIGPRAHLRACALRAFNRGSIPAQQNRRGPREDSSGHCILLLAIQMPRNMMGRLMAKHKGQFISIARIRNQTNRKGNNGPPLPIHRLKSVRRLAWSIINHDLEITVDPLCAGAAFALGYRFHRAHYIGKAAHRGSSDLLNLKGGLGGLRPCRARWPRARCWHITSSKEDETSPKRKTAVQHDKDPRHCETPIFNTPFAQGNPDHGSLTAELAKRARNLEGGEMFTIEHEFDASVITLVDEGDAPLREDVILRAFSDQITLEQWDPRTDRVQKLTLSPLQLANLTTALNLPEGIYRSAPKQK